MKINLLTVCLILIAAAFSSCEKNKSVQTQEIGYGTSFGMCAGYCKSEISISASSVKFSKSKNGDHQDLRSCSGIFTVAELNALKALVKTNDLEKLPNVIGCPDCADGGAEWVSLKVDTGFKKVTFDYGKAPEVLKDIVVKLREINASFKDCN